MSNKLKLVIKRMLAYTLDIVFLFLILAPTAFLVEWIFDIEPQTNSQIWIAAIMSFSLPAWLYFFLSDLSRGGATIGKRIMKLRVCPIGEKEIITPGMAFIRTAVKLLPWEIAHVFGFALADALGSVFQSAGLITANVLIVIYLVILIKNRGEKSLHDIVSKTKVTFSN